VLLGFPCGSAGKESRLQSRRPGFDPWVGKIPWRRERLPTPLLETEAQRGKFTQLGSGEVSLVNLSSVTLEYVPMIITLAHLRDRKCGLIVSLHSF